IIETASVEFDPGFNVITGETGAGKSIVIDSLNAALGERATAELIKTGKDTAEVQALFQDINKEVKVKLIEAGLEPSDELLIKREISRTGKGRCYINDDLVTVNTLKLIAEYLADIHGQHEHQALLNPKNQLELVDSFGKFEADRLKYTSLFSSLDELSKKRASLLMNEQEKQRKIEMLQFAIKEIEDAKLKEGEDEETEKLRNILVNSEKISASVEEVYVLLHGDENTPSSLTGIEKAGKKLEILAGIDPALKAATEALKNTVIELKEAADAVSLYKEKMDFDPARLEAIDDRRALMLKLKKKYGSSVLEIIDYCEKQKAELNAITRNEEELGKMDIEIGKLKTEAGKKAVLLSEKRKKAAALLEKRVVSELADLGMVKTKFKVDFTKDEDPAGLLEIDGKRYFANKTGMDKIQFLISSNIGEEPKPFNKIASGGEMSRVMLSLKVITGSSDKVGTLVFDEIDTGIGGNMGLTAGKKMKEAAKSRQVICITHLPQIASLAKEHIYIEKGVKNNKTVIKIEKLNKEGRVKEVARMLGGSDNKAALAHAKELLK
ncbi:MAG: DNA repair protein RecN, partial [Candidatus Firestonebacteria bacterium GWA2_43_8]